MKAKAPTEKASREEITPSPKMPSGSVTIDNQTSFERGKIPKPGFDREGSDNEDPYPNDDTIQLEDDIIKEESGERSLENIIHNMSQEEAAEDQQDRSVELQHSHKVDQPKKDDQEDIRDVSNSNCLEFLIQIGGRTPHERGECPDRAEKPTQTKNIPHLQRTEQQDQEN